MALAKQSLRLDNAELNKAAMQGGYNAMEGARRLSDTTASREDSRLGGSRSPVAGGAFGSGLGSQPSGGTPLDPGGSFGTPGATIGGSGR